MSVIIPSWNGRALLEGCLASLIAQRFEDFETIVVDNGSTDESVAWLTRQHPEVRIVRFEANCGFAAAVNAGVRAADGEIIVLLNNDTEADDAWLAELVHALDTHPEVGFCASKVLNFYDRDRLDSAGDQLGLLAGQVGHGALDGPAYSRLRPVLSACAAAAAYRRAVFDAIGLFDERFVSYLEDVDIGIRAQYAGHKGMYVPTAVVYHMVSATSRRMNHTKVRLLLRNSLFLFFQYMPPRVVLRWGAPMLIWPFVYALRARTPMWVPVAALTGFFIGFPAALRQRRAVRGSAAISDDTLLGLLSPPVGRAQPPSEAAPAEVP